MAQVNEPMALSILNDEANSALITSLNSSACSCQLGFPLFVLSLIFFHYPCISNEPYLVRVPALLVVDDCSRALALKITSRFCEAMLPCRAAVSSQLCPCRGALAVQPGERGQAPWSCFVMTSVKKRQGSELLNCR